MVSSEPQLGQRRKTGMLDIGDEDSNHPLFYLPFTKRHYPQGVKLLPAKLESQGLIARLWLFLNLLR